MTRARRALVVLSLAVVASSGMPHAAAASPVPRKTILVVPADLLREVIRLQPFAAGIGVFPPRSSSSASFIGEVFSGPLQTDAALDLTRALAAARISLTVEDEAKLVPLRVHGLPIGGARARADLRLLATRSPDTVIRLLAATAAPAPPELARADEVVIVLGVSEGHPVLIGRPFGSGLLEGVARRAGIVTPADVASTIASRFGREMKGVADLDHLSGKSLVRPRTNDRTLQDLDALTDRFERDAGYGRGLTVATVVFALGALALALALARTRRDIAQRLLQASAVAPAGYVVGLFIPSANWAVRSIGIVVLCALAAAKPAPDVRRFVGWAMAGTAAVVALLCVAAALRPNGEPALSIWGDPLVSWRFFGLRNHLAAFIAGGVIVGSLLLDARAKVMASVAAVALVVTGAPRLGANFIGVLTFAFGVSLGLAVAWHKRFQIWHVVFAAMVGVGATLLAFLSDAGSPVSHGGRAAQTIRSGGARAAWDIFAERARLNYHEVIDVPIPLAGPLAFVLLTVALGALLVWAYRARALDPLIRAAVAGGTAAAFAALFVEDSGFFTGGILGLYPTLAFALVMLAGGGGATMRSLLPEPSPHPQTRA